MAAVLGAEQDRWLTLVLKADKQWNVWRHDVLC